MTGTDTSLVSCSDAPFGVSKSLALVEKKGSTALGIQIGQVRFDDLLVTKEALVKVLMKVITLGGLDLPHTTLQSTGRAQS